RHRGPGRTRRLLLPGRSPFAPRGRPQAHGSAGRAGTLALRGDLPAVAEAVAVTDVACQVVAQLVGGPAQGIRQARQAARRVLEAGREAEKGLVAAEAARTSGAPRPREAVQVAQEFLPGDSVLGVVGGCGGH